MSAMSAIGARVGVAAARVGASREARVARGPRVTASSVSRGDSGAAPGGLDGSDVARSRASAVDAAMLAAPLAARAMSSFAAAARSSSSSRGRRVVTRAVETTGSGDGDTRVSSSVGGVIDALRGRIQNNFRMLPLALICLLVGFSMCALFPHPESPGDATICFTIIFLAEFVSSVLYSARRPRGMLKWLRKGKVFPLMLNCFKIGVLYGLFCDAFKVGS
jgi:hypothetical protein